VAFGSLELRGDWQLLCNREKCGARKKILGAKDMTIEKKSLISALKTTMKANAVKEDNATMTSPTQVLPGFKSPGAKTPGAKTPGAKTPGAKTPGAKTPGAKTPGAKTPGAKHLAIKY
jgi:transcription elongation factor